MELGRRAEERAKNLSKEQIIDKITKPKHDIINTVTRVSSSKIQVNTNERKHSPKRNKNLGDLMIWLAFRQGINIGLMHTERGEVSVSNG